MLTTIDIVSQESQTLLNSFFNNFQQDEEEWEWKRRDELIHPSDRRRIIHVRVPRRHENNTYVGGGPGPGRLVRANPLSNQD